MSDDFFDRYNAMNRDEDTAQDQAPTEAAGAIEAEAVPQQHAATIPEQPAAPVQPVQQSTWQNPYAAPQRPVSAYTNPYARTPQQNQSAPISYASALRPASGSNAYVDSEGYYHRSFTEHRTAPEHSAQRSSATPEKPQKARISKSAVAVLMIVCIIVSGLAGFGGSMLANSVKTETSTRTTETTVKETSAGTATADKGTDQITREVADSVVEITTEEVITGSYYGQYVAKGAGSGVIISDDGYIVTNNHVIEDVLNITVTLRSGESYEAELIGTDADEDIALLKINASGLTVATFGDSDTLEVGDKSIIIGNPLGTLGGSVTEGIVSALDRSIVIDGKTMHLMQTDAAINPGNSGGGMFNGQGELVGIVVAKSGGTTSSGSTIDNIGFVIPINNVLNILGDLKQYGYVRGKADTGMSFVDISNQMYAWYYFGTGSTGVFISSVERGSNAALAGFSAGDRVISVDGKRISSSSDISEIIASHSVGDTISFELERGGRTGTLELTLEEYVPDSLW